MQLRIACGMLEIEDMLQSICTTSSEFSVNFACFLFFQIKEGSFMGFIESTENWLNVLYKKFQAINDSSAQFL